MLNQSAALLPARLFERSNPANNDAKLGGRVRGEHEAAKIISPPLPDAGHYGKSLLRATITATITVMPPKPIVQRCR